MNDAEVAGGADAVRALHQEVIERGGRIVAECQRLRLENEAMRTALALVAEGEDERRRQRRALPWAGLLLTVLAAAPVAWHWRLAAGWDGFDLAALPAAAACGYLWGLIQGEGR